jgi:hypothetical protein
VCVLRWLARAASLASLGLLALFATSGGAAPSGFEWLLLAFFPLGVALGTVVAWHREILGGLIALASLAAFHALLLLDGSRPAAGWAGSSPPERSPSASAPWSLRHGRPLASCSLA